MRYTGKWICPGHELGDICPVFRRRWTFEAKPVKAELSLTTLGVYHARLNGKKIGEYVLAPGWTVYEKRLQYQSYDVTELLEKENVLEIIVGKGWYRSPLGEETISSRNGVPAGLKCRLIFQYQDGRQENLVTDQEWEYAESRVRFSEIYDGEKYDARRIPQKWKRAAVFEGPDTALIPQEGEEIREQEIIYVREILHTPAGETIVDFGQEITGYVEFDVTAKSGEHVQILHGEVLDAQGNFYNANYRNAKAEIDYICKEGEQTWHPLLTFFGFRYILLKKFPKIDALSETQFRAITVYSKIEQTGSICSSNADLNQFFSNVFWGQRCNFLDIPTDCPQRDERLGWTGDAQVFIRTASYNFNVEKFFTKWLRDMKAEQGADGLIPHVVPDALRRGQASAAWGDAAVICPWQLYLTYGKVEILEEMFGMMKGWVDYVSAATTKKYLWAGGTHFGDWLGLDARPGSYKGSSRDDLIATAFYAHATEILIKAGTLLGKETRKYKELLKNILLAFQDAFPVLYTQTEYVLALVFGLSQNPKRDAEKLADLVLSGGGLKTGFVGTPYLLYALSQNGYTKLAYSLLLRREYPSWLYSVKKGATTVWEHWDGIMEDGSFWSSDMNSFNHYAYGAAAGWVYEEAAGIQTLENYPGFQKVRIAPKPDRRLQWLEASVRTRFGRIKSKWICTENGFRYEIETPVPAEIEIDSYKRTVKAGKYILFSKE